MKEITDEMREEVAVYLGIDIESCADDKMCAFYYRCMEEDMHVADADRYAILNTLFNYDIGIDNAMAIDSWMYEHNKEIYELDIDIKSKTYLALAVVELGLDIDFSNWRTEEYKLYTYFE